MGKIYCVALCLNLRLYKWVIGIWEWDRMGWLATSLALAIRPLCITLELNHLNEALAIMSFVLHRNELYLNISIEMRG